MIEFRVLGGVDLHDAEGHELRAVLSQPKRLALLSYLAVATPRRFHRRDTLLGLFWPELDASHGRGALNRAVHFLRQALGRDVLLSRGDEELGLAFDRLRCDAVDFADALSRGEPAEALEHYRGDLLLGFFLSEEREFEQWLESERACLRRCAADAAWRVAAHAVQPADAIRAGRRAMELSVDDEAALRRYLVLLDRAGDKAGALRAYADFCQRLREEFGSEPAPETVALAETVRRRADSHPPPPAPPSVTEPAAIVISQAALSPAARPARSSPTRRAAMIAGAAGAVVLATIAALQLGDENHSWSEGGVLPEAAPRAVAVLPFQNLSSDPDNAYLGDAIANEILTALGKVDDLTVIGRASTLRHGDYGASSREIARLTGASALVMGSVQRQGNRIRISASLVDAGNERQLWAETYDREVADVFAVQAEIAEQIARALHGRISPDVRSRMAAGGTRSPEAYDLYLRGAERFRAVPESNEMPMRLLRQAVALDPNFASAWATLAFVYWIKARQGDGNQWGDSADAAARRAIAIDPNLGAGHAALALRYMYEGRRGEALPYLQRAIELDPGSPSVVNAIQSLHYQKGELDQAQLYTRRLIAMDPLNPVWYTYSAANLVALGDTANAFRAIEVYTSRFSDRWVAHAVAARWYLLLGDSARAGPALSLARALDPGEDPYTGEYIGQALLLWRRYEEARPYLERGTRAQGRNGARIGLAAVYLETGETARADSLLRAVEQTTRTRLAQGRDDFLPAVELGQVYALRGASGEAVRALELGVERGWRDVEELRRSPVFDRLRSDASFRRLLRRLETTNAGMRARATVR